MQDARFQDTQNIPSSALPWEKALLERLSATLSTSKTIDSNLRNPPAYFARSPLQNLLTTSQPSSLVLGTGDSIFQSALLPEIESAESEVLFVTCFWTPSPSLTALNQSLRRLSAAVVARPGAEKVKVRIGFSRLPVLWQLWAHPSSHRGLLWPPKMWPPHLALPSPEELPGLDLTVKSVFVPHFGVAHSKFCVVDRKVAWVPSCNVSWEAWFEGAVKFQGPAVESLRQLWEASWGIRAGERADRLLANSWLAWFERLINRLKSKLWRSEHRKGEYRELEPRGNEARVGDSTVAVESSRITEAFVDLSNEFFLDISGDVMTLILPHPNHVDPGTFLKPWRQPSPPPPTPLNTFLLHALDTAEHDIYIQTPNVTSEPVTSALLGALGRGVNVHIVTSRRLMRLEQLVLAGTTTNRFLRKRLIKPHQQLLGRAARDNEASPQPGQLTISYWKGPGPLKPNAGLSDAEEASFLSNSHLKLSIVDCRLTVLGSGNMDRPSWYVSQELGVAFFGSEVAEQVKAAVEKWKEGRLERVYPQE